MGSGEWPSNRSPSPSNCPSIGRILCMLGARCEEGVSLQSLKPGGPEGVVTWTLHPVVPSNLIQTQYFTGTEP